MKMSLSVLILSLLSLNSFAADSCAPKAAFAAEKIAVLNDLNPNPKNTRVEVASPGVYSVMTVNADGSRIGSFTVRIVDYGPCRISSVSDDDTQ